MLDNSTATFPNANFLATAVGWSDADEDALSYDFGLIQDNMYQSWTYGASSTYTYQGFEPGTYLLYVCAVRGHASSSSHNVQHIMIMMVMVTHSGATAQCTHACMLFRYWL